MFAASGKEKPGNKGNGEGSLDSKIDRKHNIKNEMKIKSVHASRI